MGEDSSTRRLMYSGFWWPRPYYEHGYPIPGFEFGSAVPIKTQSPHIGHKQHLCNLCESGDCSLEEVKELVKDAKFICKTCGRAAVAEKNLCEPVPL